ncbi:TIR domain-containing protein [Streptomyces sp. NBC_00669]|uniref:TIR domain-containing protein n=1 Tax=Streptomyces sp. NBC_00669 TaxID=2976011 RepID=UPI002E32E4B4|nr:TIR domain-containing protein [Streptomyces sp. NBC_00669]
MIDVFISHAPGDSEWAEGFAKRLNRPDIRIFLDRWSLDFGDVLVHRLDAAIRSASHGIAIISPESVGSPRVMEEYAALAHASAERQLRFIPLLIGDVALPPFAANRVWRDFREITDHQYDEKVDEIAAVILGEAAPDRVAAAEENLAASQPAPPRPLTEPPEHSFVVCYAGADAEYAGELVRQLRAGGLPVWSIGDLRPGDAHFWTVRRQLRYAVGIVVLMSPQSQDSDDVTRMILEGQQHGRPFVPILLHGERNFHLANTWYVDARDGRLLGEGELALLERLVAAGPDGGAPDGPDVDPVAVLPQPPTRPSVRAVRVPAATGLSRLDTYLAEKEYTHADLLTTSLLLEAANRAGDGWLRARDAHALPAELLAGVDAVWARHSHDRQGLRVQRGLARVRRGRHAEFLNLSVACGWRRAVDDVVPAGYQEFADRAGPGRRAGFFPTLRNPQNEHFADWYDQWSATALAVHLRLDERGTLQ